MLVTLKNDQFTHYLMEFGMVVDDDKWYIQRGGRLQGPYSKLTIHRYLLLGRIKNSDRVSKDGALWEPITQVPELIPDEMLDLSSEYGWKNYLRARDLVDERSVSSGDKAKDDENRRDETNPLQKLRDEWTEALNPRPETNRRSNILPVSLFGITLVAVFFILLLNVSQ